METFTETDSGRYLDTPATTVDELVSRAQIGAINWQSIGHDGRHSILRQWAKYLVSHIDELAGVISQETGKPMSDATLEAAFGIELLSWAAKNAHKYLKNQRRVPRWLSNYP